LSESFGNIPFANVADILGIAIAALSAEEREYSPAGGEVRRVWFNRSRGWAQLGMEEDYEDAEGMELSSVKIQQFINDIQNGYDFIFLGGFEMGGTMALHSIFKSLHPKVAGIFSIASFITSGATTLPPLLQETEISSLPSPYVPVVMMHGQISHPLWLLAYANIYSIRTR
jgi:predicted esterase